MQERTSLMFDFALGLIFGALLMLLLVLAIAGWSRVQVQGPLDRLVRRMDELEAQARLYPPRPNDSEIEAVMAPADAEPPRRAP